MLESISCTLFSMCVCVPPLVAPLFLELPEDVTTITGESANFSCRASGVPPPTVQWFKLENTSLLLMDGVKYSLHYSVEGDEVSNELTIVNITLSDSGVYQCQAGNEVNEIVSNATLEVQGITCIIYTQCIIHTQCIIYTQCIP